jgi:hypothetical protein
MASVAVSMHMASAAVASRMASIAVSRDTQVQQEGGKCRARTFKCLWGPGTDSKE